MSSPFDFPPEFLSRLRDREQDAFTTLVQQGHYRLLGFAGSVAGRELAEDIMQDAWVAIWRGLPGFEGRSSLATWLYTLVRNECFTRLKKEGREPAAQAQDVQGLEDWMENRFQADGQWKEPTPNWTLASPDSMLEEQDLQDCLEHNLADLQQDQQAVFRLRELEQLPMEQICNILDLSHSNVRVLLHRARLRLLAVVDRYQLTGEC